MLIHSAGRRRLGNALDNVLKDAGVVPRGRYVVVTDVVPVEDGSVVVTYRTTDQVPLGGGD